MAMRYGLIGLTIALVGCSEIEASSPALNSQEFVTQLIATCDAYGYRRGTDTHAQCVQQLHQQAVEAEAYFEQCESLSALGTHQLTASREGTSLATQQRLAGC